MHPRFKDPQMEQVISRLIKSLMAGEGVTYQELSQRLAQRSVDQNEVTLRGKINNGSMGSPLFLHILLALDEESLDLTLVDSKFRKSKAR